MTKYLIEDTFTEDDSYWSNEQGWVCQNDADVFTKEEKENVYLPIGGRWVKIS